MALQMSWQPISLHLLQRKTGNPPLGLRNLGNTCYLNSVLQCLTYTPPLAYLCLKNQHTSLCNSTNKNPNSSCPFCLLEKRIVRSLTIDAAQDAPYKIQRCLNTFSDHFRGGRQEDAHEFLRYVIDGCHNASLRLKKLKEPHANGNGNGNCNVNGAAGSESTVVMEIFGGALRSQVKCLPCGAESNKTDEIMDISLDLLHTTSLKDAMQRFFQPEVLDGSNKYKCEKCKKLVVAKKQMSIMKAPNILVIQLKRFEGIHGGKIDRAITFEEALLLSSYMCKESQDPHPEYNLFGTIVHSGYSPESGHYYAYIKDALGRWYCCNDSHVSVSTLQEVLSQKVYILFFSRTNKKSRPIKSSCAANGVKSVYRNGNDMPSTQEAVLAPKLVAKRPHEAHKAGKVIPNVVRNGNVHLGPPIKFGFSKTSNMGRLQGNGISLTNGHLKKQIDIKESCDMEITMNQRTSVTNGIVVNDNKSFDDAGNKLQQKLLTVENGRTKSVENGGTESIGIKTVKTEVSEDGGLRHPTMCMGHDSGHVSPGEEEKYPLTVSGHKRKSVDQGSDKSVSLDGDHAALVKFIEMITEHASAELRSCGWYDDVSSFMRANKRSCIETTGNILSKDELKKALIERAKPIFMSQIPGSLRQHLVDTLKSFHQGKKSMDV